MAVLFTANVSPTWNSGSKLGSLSTCPHWGPNSQKAPPLRVTQLSTGSATLRKTPSPRPPPPAQGPLAAPHQLVFSSQSAPSQLSEIQQASEGLLKMARLPPLGQELDARANEVQERTMPDMKM